MNLIQLLTDQRAYEGITHSQWRASWNWRWRRVGDDEDRRPLSPEPQTDSRSGLPMKNRRWRRLRLVESDNSFSLIFFGKIGFYSIGFTVCGATRWGQPSWAREERGACPGESCPPRCPSPVGLGSRNSYLLYKNSSQSFVSFRELLFLQKNTIVVLLKTTSVWG